jgi:hypothetical protein
MAGRMSITVTVIGISPAKITTGPFIGGFSTAPDQEDNDLLSAKGWV